MAPAYLISSCTKLLPYSPSSGLTDWTKSVTFRNFGLTSLEVEQRPEIPGPPVPERSRECSSHSNKRSSRKGWNQRGPTKTASGPGPNHPSCGVSARGPHLHPLQQHELIPCHAPIWSVESEDPNLAAILEKLYWIIVWQQAG